MNTMVKARVFKNEDINTAFENTGFQVFSKAFSVSDIHSAFQLICKKCGLQPGDLVGGQNTNINVSYHSTFLSNDIVQRKVIFDAFQQLLAPFISKYLNDYKIIQANVFNKPPGTGYICPHQNLTTVDESKYTSVSIWIPLQDTTIENGAIFFAPGSHTKFEKYRNANIHWEPLKVLSNIEDYDMVPVPVKVGDVIVFDDSIIHGSPDNTSLEHRLVFHALAIPIETHPIYCKKKENGMDIIVVDDTFWQYFVPGNQEPEGPVLEHVKYVPSIYTSGSIKNELRNQ